MSQSYPLLAAKAAALEQKMTSLGITPPSGGWLQFLLSILTTLMSTGGCGLAAADVAHEVNAAPRSSETTYFVKHALRAAGKRVHEANAGAHEVFAAFDGCTASDFTDYCAEAGVQ